MLHISNKTQAAGRTAGQMKQMKKVTLLSSVAALAVANFPRGAAALAGVRDDVSATKQDPDVLCKYPSKLTETNPCKNATRCAELYRLRKIKINRFEYH